jgi:predicted RNase H-like HicB family nuclease
MDREFHVVIERDSDGYYVASVPVLPGCHTQARSLDELSDRIKEAIALYLEVESETSDPLDFVAIQRVTVPS